MTIQEYLDHKRTLISGFISDYLQTCTPVLQTLSITGDDPVQRLEKFIQAGKMIRGGMVFLGHDLFQGNLEPSAILPLAASMEFYQSGLLIHDDIMDRDDLRRGEPTIFQQYTGLLRSQKLKDTRHTGEALGICLGDICFFMGQTLLGESPVNAIQKVRLNRLAGRELVNVAAAQMQDTYWSISQTWPVEQAITHMYLNKTAGYTFSLPLQWGAILAGCNDQTVDLMRTWGHSLGLLFQMKDDEIGLYGSTHDLGKARGADLREGKKTLFMRTLISRCTPAQGEKLEKILSSDCVTVDEIEWVCKLGKSSGTHQELRSRQEQLAARLRESLAARSDTAPGTREVFLSLVEYSLNRTK